MSIKTENYTIQIDSISKKFEVAPLFHNLNFSLKTGQSLAVSGFNGSGKSTFLQIMALLQNPTQGKIIYQKEREVIPLEQIYKKIGFLSPLLNPYEELNSLENIDFILRPFYNKGDKETKIDEFLDRFGLFGYKKTLVKNLSSGTRQKLKIILATINNPPYLFLDEPGTNLDKKGKEDIFSYLDLIKKERIIVIASNDPEEINFCEEELTFGARDN